MMTTKPINYRYFKLLVAGVAALNIGFAYLGVEFWACLAFTFAYLSIPMMLEAWILGEVQAGLRVAIDETMKLIETLKAGTP